jgi:Zn-dependent M28 family amino/carboxypeptidase
MISRRGVFALLLFAALAACGDEPADQASPLPLLATGRPVFDANAAHGLLHEQVAFGPRVPGRAGHRAQLAWMLERLAPLADTVVTDVFTHTHSTSGETLPLTNVMARFRPDAARRVLFLAHWDTRPTSDAARTPEARALPVPGANDGASGVAVLMQVAAHLAAEPPPIGVDLLFVDGEDYGPTGDDMYLGAKRFAVWWPRDRWPEYGVLLDMVGDADPRFPVEGYSAEYAPHVVQRVWGVASRLGYGRYFPLDIGLALGDDHVPLNEAGIPTIDVIDFEYGPGNAYWHTPDDLPERTSATTLGIVGEVVLELIFTGG